MDKETRKLIAVFSIIAAVVIIILLLLSGFELNGFEIHRGIKIN